MAISARTSISGRTVISRKAARAKLKMAGAPQRRQLLAAASFSGDVDSCCRLPFATGLTFGGPGSGPRFCAASRVLSCWYAGTGINGTAPAS